MTQERKLRKNDPAATVSPVKPKAPRSAPTEAKGSLRSEKTARIREQIRQGTYHVSATEVARAILQSASSREFSKKKGK